MSTIVIATDGSQAADSATALGLDVARALGDSVVFIAVWEMIRGEFGTPLPAVDVSYLETERDTGRQVLEAAQQRADALGIPAETVLVQGEAVREICRLADERDARMIVIGAHGWGPFRSMIRGSVAAGVLAHADRPVLTGAPGPASSAAEG